MLVLFYGFHVKERVSLHGHSQCIIYSRWRVLSRHSRWMDLNLHHRHTGVRAWKLNVNIDSVSKRTYLSKFQKAPPETALMSVHVYALFIFFSLLYLTVRKSFTVTLHILKQWDYFKYSVCVFFFKKIFFGLFSLYCSGGEKSQGRTCSKWPWVALERWPLHRSSVYGSSAQSAELQGHPDIACFN